MILPHSIIVIGTVLAAAMVIMGFTLVFLGGSRKKHTKAYVGIQMSGVNANRTPTKKWGIVVGGVFCPIPSKTPLGVNQQYPNGPYCTWTCVRNPIFDEIGCPGKSNLSSVCLLICRVFWLAGKHDRPTDLDMLTFEQIWPFSACGRPGTKIYVGSASGDLNPLSRPRTRRFPMIPPLHA